jgi:aconitate hydratase
MAPPRPALPERFSTNTAMLLPPLPADEARTVQLVKGPNIASLPDFDPLPDSPTLPVLLKMADNVSTDEILPAGARVLPFRSNIPKIAEFAFERIDGTYAARAKAAETGHLLVAGENYGQGSSREHAVIAPRYLGLRIVVAKSFARIHWQNLANFGVLALEFVDKDDYELISQDDELSFDHVRTGLDQSSEVTAQLGGRSIRLRHRLSPRQIVMLQAGGRIPARLQAQGAGQAQDAGPDAGRAMGPGQARPEAPSGRNHTTGSL